MRSAEHAPGTPDLRASLDDDVCRANLLHAADEMLRAVVTTQVAWQGGRRRLGSRLRRFRVAGSSGRPVRVRAQTAIKTVTAPAFRFCR